MQISCVFFTHIKLSFTTIKLSWFFYLKVIDAAIEILRRNNPRDLRDGQLVFVERAANVGILARDGRIREIHDEVSAGKHGTTKGDKYLQHDMVKYNRSEERRVGKECRL